MSMGQKAGSGFTSAIMGAILSMAAFDGLKATAAEQTIEAISAIKGFYLYVPIAIWIIMFFIAACYKLDKMYDKMMRELIAREGKNVDQEVSVVENKGIRKNENQRNFSRKQLFSKRLKQKPKQRCKEK